MAATFSRIVPCIWLDDQAEPAAEFYARVFPAGRERMLAALWKMEKIDIAALRRAFAGK